MRTPASLAALALLLCLAAPFATPAVPQAHAAEPAHAAPGAPYRVPAVNPPTQATTPWGAQVFVPPERFTVTCSQGPTGTVATPTGPQRVMLTASHCVNQLPGLPEPSTTITVPIGDGYTRIGTRGPNSGPTADTHSIADLPAALTEPDWAFVLIDDTVTATNLSHSRDAAGGSAGAPVQLTGIRDYRTLRPGEYSVDNFGQPICKDGATTGRSCGRQIARSRNTIYSVGVTAEMGDSGGVNFDPRDGAVIGTSNGVIGPLFASQAADRAIESAYGIPDGQVNQVFKIADPAPRAEFTTTGAERERIDQATWELNPDFVTPNPEAELRRAVDEAGQSAHETARRALRGGVDAGEVQWLVEKHGNDIALWGGFALRYFSCD